MKKSSQDFPLATWGLLLSQRQEFLNNLLARVPVTPKQQRTNEVRDEVLSIVGTQDMDFLLANDQLDVVAVIRPGIDTPFSPTEFDDLEMGGSAKNDVLFDKEEDKEKPPPTTPLSERPTRRLHY